MGWDRRAHKQPSANVAHVRIFLIGSGQTALGRRVASLEADNTRLQYELADARDASHSWSVVDQARPTASTTTATTGKGESVHTSNALTTSTAVTAAPASPSPSLPPPLPAPLSASAAAGTGTSCLVTTVRWDVKPVAVETPLGDLEARMRAIRSHGVTWHTFDRVPVAYGIEKLVVTVGVPGNDAAAAMSELEEEVRVCRVTSFDADGRGQARGVNVDATFEGCLSPFLTHAHKHTQTCQRRKR